MSAVTNFLYRQITHIGRGVTLAQGLKMRLSGEENIPDKGGAVIVCNHTGYMDFLFGAFLSLIHISEPTRREWLSRMPSSA